MSIKLPAKAPIPFIGQKNKFAKQMISKAQEIILGNGAGWTIVDVFGGSGYCAHVMRKVFPEARVVCNDFDGYADRLRKLPQTKEILKACAALAAELGIEKSKPIRGADKDRFIELLKSFGDDYDYLTVARSLVFSGHQVKSLADFYTEGFWQNVAVNEKADGESWYDGIELRKCDFRELMREFSGQPGVLLILDPPYLFTDSGTYDGGFRLNDFLDLYRAVSGNFIFFSSVRSNIIEMIKWDQENGVVNPEAWKGVEVISKDVTMNYSTVYTDFMIVSAK